MSDNHDEKTYRQITLEAACAQRLLLDEHWNGFLSDVMTMAIDQCVLSRDEYTQNEGRAMALAIRQLRALVERAAGMPQEIRDAAEQARKHE